ncbi:MAG: fumarylacetoacetate hydrolase family protein [Spirochaetales bacterium]|nr:fumarylacetoacetate hydrolase family protein [Spirochaetales bacterium]
MKYVRYEHNDEIHFGVLKENRIAQLDGDYIHGAKETGKTVDLDEVKLLAPCMPVKIIGIGANYKSFLDWKKREYPGHPSFFSKPRTAVIATNENIVIPEPDHVVNYEGELAVVIGKLAKDVPAERAMEYVFGYTCFNDVTDNTMMFDEDKKWTRGKGCDTFAPMGPIVVTDEIDPEDVMIETRLNGEVVQHMNSSDMFFHIPQLIEFITKYITLEPGDVIATGSPAGTGQIKPGDRVEVFIDGIGTLVNDVVAK